jgi:hypothetical protein
MSKFGKDYISNIISISINELINIINSLKKESVVSINNHINNLIKTHNLDCSKLVYSGKKISVLQKNICEFVINQQNNHSIINSIYR